MANELNFVVKNGLTVDTDVLYVDHTNDRIGIGTTVLGSNKLTILDTWNAGATTFNGIKMDITNTSSAAASKLIDLQVGSSSQFSVDTSGNLITNGNITVGGNSIVIEGATADGFETTLVATDPTQDNTITLQDASGTLAFLSDITGGGSATFSDLNITNSIIFEGSTVDAFETTLVVTDPTQDNTVTFQDASGTVALLGTIALGTDTTGDYVSTLSVTANGGISTTGAASGETIAHTLALDIDGMTDIGAAIADADLFAIDDGGAGTNRKTAASRIPVYTFSKVSGDITINSSGVAAIQANSVTLGTDTTGNYVATIAGTANEIEVTGSGSETAAVTIGLPNDVTIGNNLTVTGDLTVNGTTTTVNSTTVTIDDPVFTLGGDTAPGADDNLDRGIEFRWHDGAAAKVGFFGFDDSTGNFTFIPDATNTSEVFSGAAGDATFGNLNLSESIVFEGATANGFETTLTVADPTADRTITLQDASGTVAFLSDITGGGSGTFSDLEITNSIIFEGATADAFETTLVVVDPTADNTVTFQDASGTVALLGTIALGTDTTGAYVADITGGTYISTSETAAGAENNTVTINHDATTRNDTTSTDAPAYGGTFEAVTSVTTNATGHVTAIDVSTVTIPASDDTTGINVVGASNAATADATATNGNVWLNHIESGAVVSNHNIIGSGGTTVTSDANGDITISSSSTANAFNTLTVTDTDSGFTWAETGSVVADAVTDTATFVSGTNIDIDVDATNDAIRIQTTTDQHVLDNHTIISNTQTTTAVTQVALDTFSATTFAGGEVVVTAIQGTSRHIIKMLVTHDGTDTYETQFGEIITGSSLFTLTSDINTGNVRILCTPASTTSTKFNTYVTRIEN